jgi:uncharacterized protein YjbI with pentapeptide repeats
MAAKSRDEPVARVIEAAQPVNAAALTFIALCVYIGVSVASTTDEVVLLGTSIKLPLFDVSIPLRQFYGLAPFFLVFLHIHLLLLRYLLTRKIRLYVQGGKFSSKESMDHPFASLPVLALFDNSSALPIRILLSLLDTIVTVVLPVSLLLATQAKFISYHSQGITSWHRGLIVLDLLAIWYFLFQSRATAGRLRSQPKKKLLLYVLRAAAILLTVGVVHVSWELACGPIAEEELGDWRLNWFNRFFNPNISLPDYDMVAGKESASSDAARIVAVQLSDRDLQGANLQGVTLPNADFRGANLSDALLMDANLTGADFSPKGMLDPKVQELIPGVSSPEMAAQIRARHLEHSTHLRGANLSGARLQGANFVLADLRDANLSRAHLETANLFMADLRGASLRYAFLNGANLAFALLDSADLWSAQMWGTNLSEATMLGADLSRASPVAADLRWADLRMAKLSEVNAKASDFTEANTLGTDFQNAQLQGVRDLSLRGVDLRGGQLGAIDLCNQEVRVRASPLEISDLRLVEFNDLDVEDWDRVKSDLQKLIPSGEERDKALMRIDNRSKTLCLKWPFDDTPSQGRYLLYYESDMKDWPKPQLSEGAFQPRLVRLLIREACQDKNFADVLMRDIAGDSAPRRPLLAKAVALELASLLKDEDSMNVSCETMWSILQERQTREMIEKLASENPLIMDDVTELFTRHSGG